jgi:hypothetical protein
MEQIVLGNIDIVERLAQTECSGVILGLPRMDAHAGTDEARDE